MLIAPHEERAAQSETEQWLIGDMTDNDDCLLEGCDGANSSRKEKQLKEHPLRLSVERP